MRFLNKKRGIILLTAFLLVFLLWPRYEAKAQFGIDFITNGAISLVILYFQGIITGFIGNALAFFADSFSTFLKFQGQYFENVTIVETSWTIFRDFANMFFILILIIIAFATIFDIQNYNFSAKGLMAKFLIAALLINFSLAIGGGLIKISTTLSNVMLAQFSDITGNLAGGFGLTNLADQMTKGSTIDVTKLGDPNALAFGTIVSFIGIMIVASIALLSLIAAFAFSVARVPVLWALLIVSPIAWIAGILPATRAINKKWWDAFLGWTFFMPMYLFTLVMGIAILSNRPDIEAAARLGGKSGIAAVGNIIGFGAQDIFFYVLTIIILVGGLAASLKMSFFAGGGATKVFGAITGTVNDWAKKKAYIPAIQKAGKEKLGEIKETGLPGRLGAFFGGERAERLRAARVAGVLGGVLGKREALSETQAGEVQKDYARLKGQNLSKKEMDALFVKLEGVTKLKDPRIFEKFALAKLRAENGWVAEGENGITEMESTIRKAGENSKFAQEYIEALKKSNFSEALKSQVQAENFAEKTTILPLKQAVFETMAKNKQIIREDLAAMALKIVENKSKDVKDTMEKAIQNNIKNLEGKDAQGKSFSTRNKKGRAEYLLDPNKNEGLRRILALQMSEDGEVTDYQKYATAAELFGGEKELDSREMLNKIIKDKPLAHADILFRKKLGESEQDTLKADYDPLEDPNATDETKKARADMFINHVREQSKLPKMSAKSIVESDINIWNRPAFATALWGHIEDKEKKEPTKIIKGKEKAGEGRRLILRMQRALQDSPDPEKENIMKELMERLDSKYPPIRQPARQP